ncbi:hypothetical protein [Mesorhizobium sp.]|uniref:hypothetical protein n=1 Tax=Mesorhizobium sp. TaxID=1871066 RepID=UPI002580DC68|nr:hypothetical protein [Mesorhizobium sp.]
MVPRQKSSGGKQGLGKVSKMASAIFGGCSSLAPWPWFDGHLGGARPTVPGLPA